MTSNDQQPQGNQRSGTGPLVITALVLLLLILHQDNWFWTDGTLVLGFVPIGLVWHAGISIAAACTWWLATKIAWPFHEPATGDDQS